MQVYHSKKLMVNLGGPLQRSGAWQHGAWCSRRHKRARKSTRTLYSPTYLPFEKRRLGGLGADVGFPSFKSENSLADPLMEINSRLERTLQDVQTSRRTPRAPRDLRFACVWLALKN